MIVLYSCQGTPMAETDEQAAREIMEGVLKAEARELVDRFGDYDANGISDAVEAMFDALSVAGFYVAHESEAPSWMVRIKPGEYINNIPALYRVSGPDEEV